MAYADAKVASVAWLAGNVFYQLTQKMLEGSGDGSDLEALEIGVMLMQVATRYYTAQDEEFQEEWEKIQQKRRDLEERDFDPSIHVREASDLRFKELDAMFTSMVRMGQLAYQEPEATDWDV